MRSFFLVLGALLGACSDNSAPVPAGPAPTLETAPVLDAGADGGAERHGGTKKDVGPAVATAKGCGVAPASAGAVSRKTTTAAARSRTYHLSVPAGLITNEAVPLVFVLHGATDTAPENMRDWFGVEGEMPGALFVYPQALPRTRKDGSGGLVTRWDLYGNEDTSLFDAILDEVANAYCVDRARVFVTGFSSGGNFSQQLACLRRKDVKGMAVVAGPGPFSDSCGGAVSTWITHDTDDTSLPIADARGSRDFWASQNGCGKTTWTAVTGRPECQRNTSCSSGSSLVYCETSGVGHQVPDHAISAIGDFFRTLAK